MLTLLPLLRVSSAQVQFLLLGQRTIKYPDKVTGIFIFIYSLEFLRFKLFTFTSLVVNENKAAAFCAVSEV